MSKCQDCRFYFRDDDTGFSECLRADDFTDEEYEVYEAGEWLKNCPYFKEDTD